MRRYIELEICKVIDGPTNKVVFEHVDYDLARRWADSKNTQHKGPVPRYYVERETQQHIII